MAEENKDQHEESLKIMTTKDFADDLIALLKIRAPLIFLTCREEKRMLSYFKHLSEAKGFKTCTWDICNGIRNLISGKIEKTTSDDSTEPDTALSVMIDEASSDKDNKSKFKSQKINGKIYLLLDFYRFLDEANIERRIKEFSKIDSMTTIIVTGPFLDLPVGIENLFSILDFPFPNKEEIRDTVKNLLKAIGKDRVELQQELQKQFKKEGHEIVGSVSGLTLAEAQKAISKSVVVHRSFNIPTILAEKKQYIRRGGILEYYEPNLTIDDVGGLHRLVGWLKRRKLAFSPDARDFGIQALKGFLTCGIPGGGKSLVAKACANLYGVPLLRLDFGALFRSHVGESEATTREAIKLSEACAPCVSYDTQIKTRYGYITVGDAFDKFGSKFKITDNTLIAIPQEQIKIPSFDTEKNEIVNSTLKAIIRRRVNNRKMYKVTLSNGTTIKVSEDHKFLVSSGDKKEWKKMKDIRRKDKIIIL